MKDSTSWWRQQSSPAAAAAATSTPSSVLSDEEATTQLATELRRFVPDTALETSNIPDLQLAICRKLREVRMTSS
jgi:hypothetical protein